LKIKALHMGRHPIVPAVKEKKERPRNISKSNNRCWLKKRGSNKVKGRRGGWRDAFGKKGGCHKIRQKRCAKEGYSKETAAWAELSMNKKEGGATQGGWGSGKSSPRVVSCTKCSSTSSGKEGRVSRRRQRPRSTKKGAEPLSYSAAFNRLALKAEDEEPRGNAWKETDNFKSGGKLSSIQAKGGERNVRAWASNFRTTASRSQKHFGSEREKKSSSGNSF